MSESESSLFIMNHRDASGIIMMHHEYELFVACSSAAGVPFLKNKKRSWIVEHTICFVWPPVLPQALFVLQQKGTPEFMSIL